MSEQEGYDAQIHAKATETLHQANRGIQYIAEEQGGIDKAEGDVIHVLQVQDRVTNLTGISQLTADLRRMLFEQADKGSLTDSSLHSPEKRTIQNQQNFVEALLGDNPKIITQLAEAEAKLRLFEELIPENLSKQNDDTTRDLVAKINAWHTVIQSVSSQLFADELSKTAYQEQIDQHLAVLVQPREITTRDSDGNPVRRVMRSYKDSLRLSIQYPEDRKVYAFLADADKGTDFASKLIDEYLETAFTLNAMRALDRIQRPLSYNAKFRKLLSCLEGRESDRSYHQLLTTPEIQDRYAQFQKRIQDVKDLPEDERKVKIREAQNELKASCQPFIEQQFNPETDSDEAIDLMEVKRQITELNRSAETVKQSELSDLEKRQQLKNLDTQLQQIMMPIANKVDRIFPHEKSTNLIDVLDNEDAICAGKVNVLLAVSKYLGLNARANSVLEIMDNGTSGHVCYESDLPSGAKLVIDANFNNKAEFEGKTDEELIQIIRQRNPDIEDAEIPPTLHYYKRAIADAAYVPVGSRVLMYSTEKTGDVVTSDAKEQQIRETDYLFIRTNPYTGQKEVWRASVPYPHQITAPDKDGYLFINSSFCNNTAHFIKSEYKDIGIYLFKRQIEMSPYEIKAHTGYAGLLDRGEGIAYLEKLRYEKPALFYDGIDLALAELYGLDKQYDKAEAIYQELKARDEQKYYKNLHKLIKALVPLSVDRQSPEYKEKQAQARLIMEKAKGENPQLFYSVSDNVTVQAGLFGDNEKKKMAIFEEFESVAPETFWGGDKVDAWKSPSRELLFMYETNALKSQKIKKRMIAFLERAKVACPEFYVKKACKLADAYAKREDADSGKAFSVLQEARTMNVEWFHSEGMNTRTLADLYQKHKDLSGAEEVYREAEQLNPKKFWQDKYSPVYDGLIKLYESEELVEKAVTVCEEAKKRSVEFWHQSYSSGYHKLVMLYQQTGQLPDAIQCCMDAKNNDPDFLNPKTDGGGYLLLVKLYRETKQLNAAISTVLEAMNTDEKFWDYKYGEPNCDLLATLYIENGQPDSAVALYEELKLKNPNGFWRSDYYRIAHLYRQAGEIAKADQVESELIGIYSNLHDQDLESYWSHGYKKLSSIYENRGETDKVIAVLAEADEKYDLFPLRLRFQLINLYLQKGEVNKATLQYQKQLDLYKSYNREDRIAELVEEAKRHGIELET